MGLINKPCVMVVLKFCFFKILILCLYIYIYIYIFLVSGNILNKSLFMLVGIAKNLLLFDETTTILFYLNQVLFLICSTLESYFFILVSINILFD